jgi:4'-phosphopantetheinyl transferase
MIEWLDVVGPPSQLPAVWLLDLDDPSLRQAALAVAPTAEDIARGASRPLAERESVLVRRGLVKLCVASALAVPGDAIAIGWTQQGAPHLAPPFARYRLSWAQRRNRFACALALAPIGVDIEIADGGEIPWKALHPDEVAALRDAAPAERERLFLRIWAAKEAYGKALGEGLRREPSGFAVRLGRGADVIDDPAATGGSPARIEFKETEGASGIIAVLVSG